MKNLFSKSLMMAAAAMMFVSCSNEEDVVVNAPAGESEVTIGMSVIGSRASSTDVNFDSEHLQQIDNVVVVPMVESNYQNPILFGNFTPTAGEKVTKQTRTLSSLITRFKVYGNLCEGYVTPASELKETVKFAGLTLQAPVWGEGDAPKYKEQNCSKPHELYYYHDTDPAGFSASSTAWTTSAPTDWTTGVKKLGEYKSVKITPVNYAVGVLAALVKSSDTQTTFYNSEDCGVDNVIADANGKWGTADAPIKLAGVIVTDQTKSFDADFKASAEKVNVYETAADLVVKSAGKIDNDSRTGGNIYCVVAPTGAEETVTLNIVFQVAENVWYKLANGQIVGNGDYVYFNVVLDKNQASTPAAGDVNSVFQADKATFVNLNVKEWGQGSDTPIVSTDVTIGVEFDVDWGDGLVFDIDI